MRGITISFIAFVAGRLRSPKPGADSRRVLSPRNWSLASQLFSIQAAFILILIVGAGLAAYSQASAANAADTEQRVLSVARGLAATADVRDALDDPDPSVALQSLAERVRLATGTDFVVVMSVNGTRYSHPDPAQIGGQFVGHIEAATRGDVVTETFTGTLGPSVRAVVPVIDGGHVQALIAVGVTLTALNRELERQLPLLLGTGAVALLLAGFGSWLLSRWLRRTTHDLGPRELGRMYEYYDAVLHAVREGLLLLNRDGRVALVNDEARRLLTLSDAAGRRVDELGLPPALGNALLAGQDKTDEMYVTADRIVVVSQAAARWAGKDLGTVVTLRDHTELRALTSELNTIRGFAESLNAQAHEAANQLHTVISLIELGRPQDALRFATAELATAQHLTDVVVESVHQPELAALLLGKAAEASERGAELVVAEDMSVPASGTDPHDLVTIVGNLLDNAIDAALSAPPPHRVAVAARVVSSDAVGNGSATGCGELVVRVADSGPGIHPADVEQAFQRGWSSKASDRPLGRGLGLALVAQAVHRHGGTIEVSEPPGVTFTVHLPLRKFPSQDEAGP